MSVGREFIAARPSVAETAWVAPGATVVGDVAIAGEASVWYGCVLRGDLAPIRIGAASIGMPVDPELWRCCSW